MSLHDFSTAVEYDLPIKIVVLRNNELGFVKIEMEEAGLAPNYDALEVKNFDFAEYANITGGEGFTLKNPADVDSVIKSAKSTRKPVIIDAHVSSGALSLPPKIEFGMAKNFAVSKIKEVVAAIKGDTKNWENIKEEVMAYLES
jgi:thiamine pyrophosphate-dependent acetolactate synthase large subunit-like protein